MTDTLTFELVTPLGIHEAKEVKEVVIPAESGEMGVLPGHDVMIVSLGIGALTVIGAKGNEIFFTARGYVEIENDHVRVLAEICDSKDDVDLKRAEKAAKRAKERLEKTPDQVDWKRATSSLKRSTERIRIAREM